MLLKPQYLHRLKTNLKDTYTHTNEMIHNYYEKQYE